MHFLGKFTSLFAKYSLKVPYTALFIVLYCWFDLICIKKSIKMHLEELIRTIKKRRESLKVTQETLAELSGVGLRTLKQFESGKGNPTFMTLQKLADVLGLELSLKLKSVPGSK